MTREIRIENVGNRQKEGNDEQKNEERSNKATRDLGNKGTKK